MRKILLASTCCLCFATAAHAETSISTKQTAPVRTSTIKQGAADDIKITADGGIELTAPATAVTVDSANKVTNAGTIKITNANDSTGIFAQSGTSGGIDNSGTITVGETYTATDTDNDGDLDGAMALGTNRYGIAVGGAYSGAISNSGQIAVKGNDSWGILVNGPLTGTFTHDGSTAVVGDRARGIELQDVSGNVRVAGAVTATGLDAVGVHLRGDIGGTLTVQGGLSSTGYRLTTAPSDPSKLEADDLLQGGSALIVEGNVAGGIILAIPPKDASTTDNDEDKDGIEDSKEGSAAVRSYGAAPAMRIGAVGDEIAIGAVPGTGTGYGLIIEGTVQGVGVYNGVTARGLQIGGLGGDVQIAGGIAVSGSVSAVANNASATALFVGAGASMPKIYVSGTVEASGSKTAGTASTAIDIAAGASVPTISNAGKITATASAADGTAVAIQDRSGTVTLVENSGTISATGATADSGRNLAIDLSGAAAGVTVKQTVVASGFAAPAITGNILLGAGDDTFDVADGTVTGVTSFGAGNDTLKLSGDAVYDGKLMFDSGSSVMAMSGTAVFKGTADFGGGAGTLSIGGSSVFNGNFANSDNLAVTVAGGGLRVTQSSRIASLNMTDKGVLAVSLGEAGNTTALLTVTGTASFAADSKLALQVTDIAKAEGNHLVLTAGTLTGAGNVTAESVAVPFLYKATLNAGANDLTVAVARKTKSELGLNGSEAIAFDPVYAALGKDEDVAAAFLNVTSQEAFSATLRQMLPDHAGGTFAAVTMGSRTLARMLEDPKGPFKDEGRWGYWINQQYWTLSKAIGDTAGYDVTGWSFGGGAEVKTDVGNFGASLAYLWSNNRDKGSANEVRANQYEVAGYWRLREGRLRANVRGSFAYVDLAGTRSFEGYDGEEAVSLTASSDRSAKLYSGSAMLTYEFGSRWTVLRPVISVDYYRLNEKAYTETGGGDAFNLAVAARKSDELAVTASGVVGFNWGGQDQWAGWSRIELEAGRREIVSGELGKTVAHFTGGQAFTLVPEARESGWIGRVRGMAGNAGFQIGGEFGAEENQGRMAMSLRASLRIGL